MAEYIKLDNLYDIIEYDNDINKWTIIDEDLNSLPKVRWIPTAKQMPPDEKIVIGYTPADSSMFIGYHCEDWGRWICLGPMGAPRVVTKKVTHWMQCPDAP